MAAVELPVSLQDQALVKWADGAYTLVWIGGRHSEIEVLKWIPLLQPGPWFNKKMSSYQYRKSHCGDKTILRPSYLHNGISYTGKTTSLYWIGAQMTIASSPTKNSTISPWPFTTWRTCAQQNVVKLSQITSLQPCDWLHSCAMLFCLFWEDYFYIICYCLFLQM